MLKRSLLLTAAVLLLSGCNSFGDPDPWASDGRDALGVGDPPAFPTSLEHWSYRAEWTDMPRAFVGDDWTATFGPDARFPSTDHGCHDQRFLVRWRSTGMAVQAAALDELGTAPEQVEGESGWMDLTGCSTPAFKLAGPNDDGGNLVDVVVEVRQYWPGV